MTDKARGQRRLGLGPDVGVALAVCCAPLAVADDGQRRAGILEHGRGDVAGMRALVGGVAVLPADGEAGAARTPRSISVAGRHRATSQRAGSRPPWRSQ